MKKFIILLSATIIMLCFNSCANENQDYNYNIKEALKISAYLFDETKGEDYFIQKEDGTYRYRETSDFETAQLNLNEVKLMAPMNYWGTNLNIYFEFDGIIEIISEDKDVQMFINPKNLLEPITYVSGNEPHGFEMNFPFEGFIAANPLGSNYGHIWAGAGVNWLPSYIGREYYLTVNAYKADNEQSAVIRARLKLVQLEDKASTEPAGFASACFSIELVSYEYSNRYVILDEIGEDED